MLPPSVPPRPIPYPVILCASIIQLREQFLTLDWTYHKFPVGSQSEKMFCRPGPPDEEILICVHQSGGRQELFHRHDFFISTSPIKVNMILSVISMTTVSPSKKENSMQDSPLPDMPFVSMMIKKQQSLVFSYKEQPFSGHLRQRYPPLPKM